MDCTLQHVYTGLVTLSQYREQIVGALDGYLVMKSAGMISLPIVDTTGILVSDALIKP